MIKPRQILPKIEKFYNSREAIIITGMRRTGKTTILKEVYNRIDSNNSFFIDLENPLNRKYFEEDNYERIKNTLSGLGIDFSTRAYIFIDEIQFLPNLPSVVKYFIDHYNTKFFLTGSASFYLKNLFTESLSGRKFVFHLHPLNFQEFLSFKDSSIVISSQTETISQPLYESISILYDEFITYGGFPGVVLKETIEEKKRSLDDIFTSFYNLEVIQLGDFRRNDSIRDLMLLLMQRTGTKLDIQKLSKELEVSRPTIKEYISFLNDTFFIKTISPLSKGRDTEIRKSPKVYICDSGLVNHIVKIDTGRLFENTVFQHLHQKGDIHYYQRKSGVELDFILNRKYGYEIKTSPNQSDLKKIDALSKDLGLEKHTLISKRYSTLPGIIYGFQL